MRVAGNFLIRTVLPKSWNYGSGLTVCVILGWLRPRRVELGEKHSVRVDCSFIDQQDGDIVLDGIDTTALSTLKSFALGGKRSFAGGADENVQQVLVDHTDILLQEGVRGTHSQVPS
jgi:hypothetical protein